MIALAPTAPIKVEPGPTRVKFTKAIPTSAPSTEIPPSTNG